MIYLIREARHMGVALGLDSIRYLGIDIDLRHVTDYLLLKSQGVQGLSRDLKWLYRYINAGLIRNMSPNRFIIVSKNGAIGYGIFDFPQWHKKEKENILKAVGVKIEYGEVLKESKSMGTFRTVSDLEHMEMIRLYIEENLGFVKIGEKTSRSSATAQRHVAIHNNFIKTVGFCVSCKRAKGQYYERLAERGQISP